MTTSSILKCWRTSHIMKKNKSRKQWARRNTHRQSHTKCRRIINETRYYTLLLCDVTYAVSNNRRIIRHPSSIFHSCVRPSTSGTQWRDGWHCIHSQYIVDQRIHIQHCITRLHQQPWRIDRPTPSKRESRVHASELFVVTPLGERSPSASDKRPTRRLAIRQPAMHSTRMQLFQTAAVSSPFDQNKSTATTRPRERQPTWHLNDYSTSRLTRQYDDQNDGRREGRDRLELVTVVTDVSDREWEKESQLRHTVPTHQCQVSALLSFADRLVTWQLGNRFALVTWWRCTWVCRRIPAWMMMRQCLLITML